jgi:hypothetical protein
MSQAFYRSADQRKSGIHLSYFYLDKFRLIEETFIIDGLKRRIQAKHHDYSGDKNL